VTTSCDGAGSEQVCRVLQSELELSRFEMSHISRDLIYERVFFPVIMMLRVLSWSSILTGRKRKYIDQRNAYFSDRKL
jgi:hypothetical protein